MVKKMIYFLLIDTTSIKVWNSLQEILNLLKFTFYLYTVFFFVKSPFLFLN